jgi:hypothetical protein
VRSGPRMSGRTRAFVRTSNRAALARLQAVVAGLDQESLRDASRRSVIAVQRAAGTLVQRDVRSRYGVKLSALKDGYRVVQGRSRKGDAYVGVEASARRISLLEFGGRWSRPKGGNLQRMRSKGATAAVQAGARKAYPGAFIADIGWRGVSGAAIKADTVKRGIYVRQAVSGGTGKRHGRGPVRLLRGPSPLEMLLGQDMRHAPAMSAKLQDIYETELARQIQLALKRRS